MKFRSSAHTQGSLGNIDLQNKSYIQFQAGNLEIISAPTTMFKFVEASTFQNMIHIQDLEQIPGNYQIALNEKINGHKHSYQC